MHCVRDELGSLLRVIKIALFELVTLQLDQEERDKERGGKGGGSEAERKYEEKQERSRAEEDRVGSSNEAQD